MTKNLNVVKTEILEEFKHKNIFFHLDEFQQDVKNEEMARDISIRKLYNTNYTSKFNKWLNQKPSRKEQVKINIMGQTRSGKSLIGLKILYTLTKFYDFDKNNFKQFNTPHQVCANQNEYVVKCKNAVIGDSFLIDENAFNTTGEGANSMRQQIQRTLDVSAKKNLHSIFITPRYFLPTGATVGLKFDGKDVNNWLSRFLVYYLGENMPPRCTGFVVFDIGDLFHKNGCFIYRSVGGCTNPERLKSSQIPEKYIKVSSCIPKNYDKKKLNETGNDCPFYNVCTSQLCAYEQKKDNWIKKQLEGGKNERLIEKYKVAYELFKEVVTWDDKNNTLQVKETIKSIHREVKANIGLKSSMDFTLTEKEDISNIVKFDLLNPKKLKNIFIDLELDFDTELKQLKQIAKNNKDEMFIKF